MVREEVKRGGKGVEWIDEGEMGREGSRERRDKRQETERSARRAVGKGAKCVVPASGVPAARHLLSIASAACAPGVSAWRSFCPLSVAAVGLCNLDCTVVYLGFGATGSMLRACRDEGWGKQGRAMVRGAR
jgi:hypothetical protein